MVKNVLKNPDFLSRNWALLKKQNRVVLGGGGAFVLLIAILLTRAWIGGDASAKGPQRARIVSVEIVKAEKKQVPVDVDSIGMVTPISSVALKSRVETTIVDVHFKDGARVNEGDLLFTLDGRQIDAQIAQAEGNLAKSRSQLELAQRDHKRYSDLITKGATTQVSVDNAKTAMDTANAQIIADQATLDNLKVQKSYTLITAPISGRISAASVKIGNFVRPADTSPLATINQMAPVYVTFTVPQRVLSDLRDGMKDDLSSVVATIPGSTKSETGKIAMVENTVDPTTGMVTVRGIMGNDNELLWPGILVNTKLIVRNEQAVVVPSVAVQRSQSGSFVFVVKDGKAVVQPVTVNRTSSGISVIGSGLSGDEDIVTDGQLLLSNGTSVETRARKAGA
ncbi:MAG: efflux RND transporter periplasmic adaptor subunit [Afipia sp.]|nr:efflux RND transporter periplasmic adaptor subunit [Afipia sp.]